MAKRKRAVKNGLRLTPELPLFSHQKRRCACCGENEVYLDIRTLDWCEPCIWRFVNAGDGCTR
jgi:hypothetical protein